MRVLLAEDDPVTRRVLSFKLQRWGYTVTTVGTGDAALAILAAPDAPRIAILNWEMPGMDGVEVCARFRLLGIEPYTYILLLTGRQGCAHLVAGLDAGADDYLTKPFDDGELAARLRVGGRVTALQDDLLQARESLRHQALHDGLTGLLNRVGTLQALDREVAQLGRRGPLAVVMLDLDHFKRVNDTWGHIGGDMVLREATRRMGAAIRVGDRLGRMGGEEFLAVLPGCDRAAAVEVAERMCARVAEEPIRLGEARIAVTCSAGVSAAESVDEAADLVERADEALYRAKRGGRNRVEEAGVARLAKAA